MTAYPELEIGLHRFDAEAWTVDLRFNDPESDGFDSSATSTKLVDFQHLRELQADDKAYGLVLGQALLADAAIRERFARARAIAQARGLPLRVRLFIGPSAAPELQHLRWETLREPQERVRLLTDEHLLFSRFLSSDEGVSVPFRPRAELRALVVIANPSDLADYGLAPLDVAAELQLARTGLGDITCTELPGQGRRPTLADITAHLREGYDILYLVCHGAMRTGETHLWLEDDTGHTQRLPGQELADRLRELTRRPRLVVLAACQSAGDGSDVHAKDDGALAALGPKLAREGIPAVVAMQGNVSKYTVEAFMPRFFQELQRDGQIDRAMTVARAAVSDQNRPDWWMFVLFLALKSGRIWYEPGFEVAPGQEMEKWPALLRSIQGKHCTPILGPGLVESLVGSRREIAMRWASDYRYPMAQYDRQNLPQVAQYLAVHLDPAFVRDELLEHLHEYMLQQYGDNLPEEVRKESLEALLLAEGKRRRERDPAEPHKVLAELPFRVYVTAGLSNLLGDALVDAGKKPEIELCRWNDELKLEPPIYEQEPDYLPSTERPFVYHVFGHLKDPDSLALTQDDYFDFLIGVTKNNDMIPHFVRSALADTALLFLGFRLDEWDFRVLFRSLMSQEGRYLRRKYSHVAVQIDPEEGQMSDPEGARRYLSSYFQDARITLYWGSAETFARELKQRWESLPQ